MVLFFILFGDFTTTAEYTTLIRRYTEFIKNSQKVYGVYRRIPSTTALVIGSRYLLTCVVSVLQTYMTQIKK
jgi:hypothetical protein